jgi:hypothetical protein
VPRRLILPNEITFEYLKSPRVFAESDDGMLRSKHATHRTDDEGGSIEH